MSFIEKISKFLPHRSWKAFLVHLSIVTIISFVLLYYFFNIHLPSLTHHGQKQKVPSLQNLTLLEAQDKLRSQGLRDSVFKIEWSPKHKPSSVISQNPTPGSFVKKNRMVYLVINQDDMPKVTITKEILKKIRHVNNAQALHELRALGFKVRPHYLAQPNKGYVYRTTINDKPLEEGQSYYIGTMVVIHIGRGVGKKEEQFTDTEKYD